jgi:hypothetical protein
MIEVWAFNAVTWIAVRFGRLEYMPRPLRQLAHAVLVPWAKRLAAKGGADIVVTQSKNSA